MTDQRWHRIRMTCSNNRYTMFSGCLVDKSANFEWGHSVLDAAGNVHPEIFFHLSITSNIVTYVARNWGINKQVTAMRSCHDFCTGGTASSILIQLKNYHPRISPQCTNCPAILHTRSLPSNSVASSTSVTLTDSPDLSRKRYKNFGKGVSEDANISLKSWTKALRNTPGYLRNLEVKMNPEKKYPNCVPLESGISGFSWQS